MPKGQGKINPRIVAQGLAQGKKKIDIAVEAGSNATRNDTKCRAVTQVANSSKFEEEALPFVKQMEIQRDRAIKALEAKDLGEEKVRDLNDLIDKFTKNIQLLTGKPTERSEVNIEQSEQIKKALEDV